VGWDCSQRAVAEARSRGWQADVRDVTSAPIGNDEKDGYDLVVFLEVLEHLVDTDLAIKNIHGLLKPDGVLVLSTPNLAAWYNRVLLLLGFQPHMTEVSNCPIRFGCRFIGKLLGEQEGVTNISAGHLRLFTFRALKEFLSYHQFKIDKIWGVSNHKYDFVSKILAKMWVGGSGNLICFVRKK
jgi:2-polyprenyl-3-methyl-5-hydroxy-6-metoxy-1,4-benzoquinol methylase